MSQSNRTTGQKTVRRIAKPLLFVFIGIIMVALLLFSLSALNKDDRAATNNTDTLPSNNQPSNKQDAQVSAPPQATGTIITTGDSAYGTMLFNDKKQAIYIWEKEASPEAKCYDDCAEAWPPVLTDGAPQASGEAKSELLGTTTRADGSVQVTYNGHPLYYYAHEGPGEVECHNVSTHGGLWWVIQPNGNRAS